jgi:hypothetical protein
MTTKAQQFRSDELEKQRSLKREPASRRSASSKPEKAHNLSARAGRTARVSYEPTNGRASRKSTRGSAHHQRATSQLERTHQLAQSKPETRARASQARGVKVRGK